METLNVPKRYQDRFFSLEREKGLIDDCKYILTLNGGWQFDDGGKTIPVRSKAEAIEWLKEAIVDDFWDRWECEPRRDDWDEEY